MHLQHASRCWSCVLPMCNDCAYEFVLHFWAQINDSHYYYYHQGQNTRNYSSLQISRPKVICHLFHHLDKMAEQVDDIVFRQKAVIEF